MLFYTDHYQKNFNSEDWGNDPRSTTSSAKWLGEKQISAFGVETISPGIPEISNKEVHHICGEMNFIFSEFS